MGTDRPFTSTVAADVVGAVSTVLEGPGAAGGMGALFAVDAGIAVSLRSPGPKATQRVV